MREKQGNKKIGLYTSFKLWNAKAKDCDNLFTYNEAPTATSKEVKWYKETLKNKDK